MNSPASPDLYPPLPPVRVKKSMEKRMREHAEAEEGGSFVGRQIQERWVRKRISSSIPA